LDQDIELNPDQLEVQVDRHRDYDYLLGYVGSLTQYFISNYTNRKVHTKSKKDNIFIIKVLVISKVQLRKRFSNYKSYARPLILRQIPFKT